MSVKNNSSKAQIAKKMFFFFYEISFNHSIKKGDEPRDEAIVIHLCRFLEGGNVMGL